MNLWCILKHIVNVRRAQCCTFWFLGGRRPFCFDETTEQPSRRQLSCIKDGLICLVHLNTFAPFSWAFFNGRCSRHGGNGVLIAFWVMDLRPGPRSCKVLKMSGTSPCVRKALRLAMGTVSPVVKSKGIYAYRYIIFISLRIVIIYRRAFLNKLAISSVESSPRLLMAWALIFPTFAGFITSLLPPWYFGGNPIICQHNINDRVVPRSSKSLRLFSFWFWEAMFRKISFRLEMSWRFHVATTHFRFAQHLLISSHFMPLMFIQVERYYQQQLGVKCLFLMTFSRS